MIRKDLGQPVCADKTNIHNKLVPRVGAQQQNTAPRSGIHLFARQVTKLVYLDAVQGNTEKSQRSRIEHTTSEHRRW